jgi:hypothetical protein
MVEWYGDPRNLDVRPAGSGKTSQNCLLLIALHAPTYVRYPFLFVSAYYLHIVRTCEEQKLGDFYKLLLIM